MAKKATKKPAPKPARNSGGKAGGAAPKKSAKAKAAPKKKGAAKPVAKKPAPKKAAKPVKKAAPAKPARTSGSKAAPKKPAPKAKPAAKPAAKKSPAPPKKAAPVSKPEQTRKPAVVAVAKKDVVMSKPKNQEDNRSRYSDAELVEFKALINKKLEEATRDYELLKNTLSHKDDHGTDDTSPTFKLLEDGSDVLSKEETAHLAARQEKYIQNLKNALIRIQNKTYGICRITGKLIPKERLRSVPHATLSIDAKLGQNR